MLISAGNHTSNQYTTWFITAQCYSRLLTRQQWKWSSLEWRLDEYLILQVSIWHTSAPLCISWHLKDSFGFKWEYPGPFLCRFYTSADTEYLSVVWHWGSLLATNKFSPFRFTQSETILFFFFFFALWKHFVHFGYKSWEFCFSAISVTNCEMLPVL